MNLISVVRDFDLYQKLIQTNPFTQDATCTPLDNSRENKHISVRYNEFLNTYDYTQADWFIFCHEDWELKEDLSARLAHLDKGQLYGCIGRMNVKKLGQITQSDKNGRDHVEQVGIYCNELTQAMCFDCQCLIVHSELINKHQLRFDENLSFDLYVEDFCIHAREQHDIKSYILQLECQHYSRGNVQERYFEQLRYLKEEKYKQTKHGYMLMVTDDIIGRSFSIKLHVMMDQIAHFFYQDKITQSGRRIIKVCKIPIYRKKVS